MKSTKSPSWIRRLLGADPVRVPPHVFSLDERNLVYLGLAEGGELYCKDCLVEPLSEDCFQEGPLGGRLRDQESLSDSLETLLDRLALRPPEASLVLPDSWIRFSFVDSEEWPRRRDDQLEVLRFKLGRVVPFRVQELRIGAEPVPTIDGAEPNRFLVGFGIDSALSHVEETFAAQGVHIGHVSNRSLSLLSAVAPTLAGPPLAALVRVDDERYCLIVTRHGQPVVYRSKAHGQGGSMAPVGRELRLTRSFLQERLAPGIVSEVILAAPEGRAAEWSSLLEETFEHPVTSLEAEWPSIPGLVNLTTHQAAPLLGAALREVA